MINNNNRNRRNNKIITENDLEEEYGVLVLVKQDDRTPKQFTGGLYNNLTLYPLHLDLFVCCLFLRQ